MKDLVDVMKVIALLSIVLWCITDMILKGNGIG